VPTLDDEMLVTFDEERERNRLTGNLIELVIRTNVPTKWRFVDMETGDIWRHSKSRATFIRADDIEVKRV
jgi:hypothetical protein